MITHNSCTTTVFDVTLQLYIYVNNNKKIKNNKIYRSYIMYVYKHPVMLLGTFCQIFYRKGEL